MADGGGGVATLVRMRHLNNLYNCYPVIIADESLLQLKMPYET